ncbi:FecR family protein [Janthinobacterium fluminis]|uniref:DUF4880 domain-containing protein n=1 Tax=Janthinobacterium fluminis TaxID=2987524 RepID=A0ABT5JUK3_9BURK|nr:FecR domain-containing protein [Janthinobacterium fluminis]MDC8756442.1 DUF4880 domain-containing protein [Janthinobacterium fluminis]
MKSMSNQDTYYSAARQQAVHWWTRLHSGQATRGDAAAFRQWCGADPRHARAWRELTRVWRALEPALAAQAGGAPFAAAPRPAARGRRVFLGGALAAALGGVLALRPPLDLWPAVDEFAADYRTGTGEQRQVALDEQVTVQMNTQTRFNVRAGDGIALLAGEAEIVVRGAHAFAVEAGGGRLLARSGRFNVRQSGPQVCVTCLDGRVELLHAGLRRSLAAGSQAVYEGEQLLRLDKVDAGSVVAWRSGVLAFADAPLAEVVDEINRYRPGRLMLCNAELGRRRVRMRLSLRNIAHAPAMIRDLSGATLRELPGGIVLLS